jgi:hypothetical protein
LAGGPSDRVKRYLHLVPLDTRIFDPEVGVVSPAPIGHGVNAEELLSKIQGAHLAIFLEVPGQLVLQGVRVTSLQRTRRIVWRRVAEYLTTSIAPRRNGTPLQ